MNHYPKKVIEKPLRSEKRKCILCGGEFTAILETTAQKNQRQCSPHCPAHKYLSKAEIADIRQRYKNLYREIPRA